MITSSDSNNGFKSSKVISTGFPAGIDNSIRLKIESASMYERQYVFHLTSNSKPNNEKESDEKEQRLPWFLQTLHEHL